MKVLLVNNFHYLRGGAERAYFNMAKILEDAGHEVAFFSVNHPESLATQWSEYFPRYDDLSRKAEGGYGFLKQFKLGSRALYNFEAKKSLRKLINDFRPDVAHLHNIFHYLTPSIINELKKQGVPTVMTLHDFKIVSPNNMLFSRGGTYEGGKNGKYYECFFDKSVDNSAKKSFALMIEMYLIRWLKVFDKVDVFTAPSDFLIDKTKEFGFERGIVKLNNPMIFEDYVVEKKQLKDDYILYFGRLSQEKGVDKLIKAYSILNPDEKLFIVGDGPQKDNLQSYADSLPGGEKVCFLGWRSQEELVSIIANAKVAVNPSQGYENAPYCVLEAMFLGAVTVCSDKGGFREMVEDGKTGYLFRADDVGHLAEKLKVALSRSGNSGLEGNAREYVVNNFSPEVFYESLMGVYKNL